MINLTSHNRDLVRERLAHRAEGLSAASNRDDELSIQRKLEEQILQNDLLLKNQQLLQQNALQEVAKDQIKFDAQKQADFVPYEADFRNRKRVALVKQLVSQMKGQLVNKGTKPNINELKKLHKILDVWSNDQALDLAKPDKQLVMSELQDMKSILTKMSQGKNFNTVDDLGKRIRRIDDVIVLLGTKPTASNFPPSSGVGESKGDNINPSNKPETKPKKVVVKRRGKKRLTLKKAGYMGNGKVIKKRVSKLLEQIKK